MDTDFPRKMKTKENASNAAIFVRTVIMTTDVFIAKKVTQQAQMKTVQNTAI